MLKDWPALMDLATAGDYLALSPGSLINLLRRENVSPVDVGSRHRRWRRRDLDALVERLPAAWDQGEDGPDAAVDTALAAVERRARERRRNPNTRRSGEVRQPHPAA
ncbi:hypothetical protein ACFODL_07100 [Phenylobacterium terrae]|uniref:Helix-turn-helix domain-containing protein n=1 Tax=Phenylobacterium terrae TaxID=2665495 RepID=A0ABW4N6V3_9CAUL